MIHCTLQYRSPIRHLSSRLDLRLNHLTLEARIMRPKTIVSLLFFLVLVFIGFGDVLLPEPLGTASATARSQVNQFIIGLFPYVAPVENPHQRTEGEIKHLERHRTND